ncbi:anthrone oxygenase family protein [Arthrobacter sp. MDT3-24]
MARTPRFLAAATGLGSCAVGAVYSIFSLNVMPALAQLPAAEAIDRMQHFNRDAVMWPFMTLFFGTAVLSAYTVAKESGAGGLQAGLRPRSGLRAAGSGLYLAGFLMTIAYHVPRNEALDRLDPASAAAPAVWERFLAEWTSGNHVRAALSIAGAGLLVFSAVRSAPRSHATRAAVA